MLNLNLIFFFLMRTSHFPTRLNLSDFPVLVGTFGPCQDIKTYPHTYPTASGSQQVISSEWAPVVLLMHVDTLLNLYVFVLATSDEEMSMWVKGLNWLVADTLRSPTPLQIERFVLLTDL